MNNRPRPTILTDIDTAVILAFRRHAPDVTMPEIAAARHVPLRAVQRVLRGVVPEVPSKSEEYRRSLGLLSIAMKRETGKTWEEIAEIAGCTRQHLHRCRLEAKRGG